MKILKYLFVIGIIVLSINSLEAQTKGSLRGMIVDSTKGEVLPFCNVLIVGTNNGASTDNRGYFVFPSLESNKLYTLRISYIGYKSKDVKVFIESDKLTSIKIELSALPYELAEIVKVGDKFKERNALDLGLQKIQYKDLQKLPKGVEMDIFRAFQYYAGVRSTGDVSAKFFVRGGSSNQNLILLDGMTLYNPYHAFGIFSSIDPEIINSVEFYKGGFTTEFGGRLSSVVNIKSKDGNINNFSGKAAASFLTGKVLLEGPVPSGSFYLSYRGSISNKILEKFLDNKSVPVSFYDASFKVKYDNPILFENGKIIVQGMVSGDELIHDDLTKEDFTWKSSNFAIAYQHVGAEIPLFLDLTLSYNDYQVKIIPKLSNVNMQDNLIYDFSIKSDFTYVYKSNDELKIGLHMKEINSIYKAELLSGTLVDNNEKGTDFSMYVKYKFLRYDNFGIDVGSRLNYVRLARGTSGEHFLEPRLSISYSISPLLKLKLATGIYNQELITISDEDGLLTLFEPWIITPGYLKPSNSFQTYIGADYYFSDALKFEIEAYYKNLKNIPIVNKNKFTLKDKELLAADGKAYGIDLVTKYSYEDLALNVSYSLGWVYNTLEGETYRPKYDSRHAVTLGLDYNLGKGWNCNVQWIYNSGKPFTKLAGFYSKLNIGDYISDLSLSNFSQIALLDKRNAGMLPDFHRLDLNVSKRIEIGFIKGLIDFNIINLYNRKNIFYFKKDTKERVNMLPFLPTVNIKVEV